MFAQSDWSPCSVFQGGVGGVGNNVVTCRHRHHPSSSIIGAGLGWLQLHTAPRCYKQSINIFLLIDTLQPPVRCVDIILFIFHFHRACALFCNPTTIKKELFFILNVIFSLHVWTCQFSSVVVNDITIAISSIQHHPAVCARYAAWRYPLLCTVFYVNSKAKDLLLQSRNITIFKPFLTQTISVTFLQNIASAGTFLPITNNWTHTCGFYSVSSRPDAFRFGINFMWLDIIFECGILN